MNNKSSKHKVLRASSKIHTPASEAGSYVCDVAQDIVVDGELGRIHTIVVY